MLSLNHGHGGSTFFGTKTLAIAANLAKQLGKGATADCYHDCATTATAAAPKRL